MRCRCKEQQADQLKKQARIAEEAGAAAVMALERVPADIRVEGGVARMSDPQMIKEIMEAVTIPVMAKARIGHFVECQVDIPILLLLWALSDVVKHCRALRTLVDFVELSLTPHRSSSPSESTTSTSPRSSPPPTRPTTSSSTPSRHLSSADAATWAKLSAVSPREPP